MEAAVGNIGERGCRRRRMGGWVWGVVAVVALGVMIAMHVSRLLLLTLALPIGLSALGFFQAQEQTCVVHAVLGTRENDDGVVKLDPAQRAEVGRRARRVAAQSILAGLGGAAAIYYFSRYR